MRLTLPEPKIDLYSDGFDEHDKLSRKSIGDKLSKLVEDIDDPLVIALDGAWGSGKSFFLKCWVGEHLKREGNTTQTVYFDAFKHDFLDDPLVALTGAIAERFEEANDTAAQEAWKKAKQVAPALGRAIIRAGASVVTAGLLNKADELADAAIKSFSGELDGTVADFWKRESGKRAAMDRFRKALVDLTEPNEEGAPTRKLVIVIDELDRCRPDFALNLLEVIKHFFSVDGVHFILGVNLTELGNCVSARYGQDIDAPLYLQKFVTISMRLRNQIINSNQRSTYLNFFEDLGRKMEIDNKPNFNIGTTYLQYLANSENLSLRGIQQFARLIATTPAVSSKSHEIYSQFILVGLLYMKAFAPEMIDLVRKGEFSWREVERTIKPTHPHEAYDDFNVLSTAWYVCFPDQLSHEFWSEYLGSKLNPIFASYDKNTPYSLLRNYVDIFELT
ncbi:MAG: P-loop NTPase fold protein [Ruegeria sp.]